MHYLNNNVDELGNEVIFIFYLFYVEEWTDCYQK